MGKITCATHLARGYDYFCDDVAANIEVSGDFIRASYNIRIGVQ